MTTRSLLPGHRHSPHYFSFFHFSGMIDVILRAEEHDVRNVPNRLSEYSEYQTQNNCIRFIHVYYHP